MTADNKNKNSGYKSKHLFINCLKIIKIDESIFIGPPKREYSDADTIMIVLKYFSPYGIDGYMIEIQHRYRA